MTTLLRTVRHLRPSQWWWRARYTLERRSAVGPRRAARWRWKGTQPPRVSDAFPELGEIRFSPAAAETFAQLKRGVFRHLNQSEELGLERPDWQLGPVTQARLWTIALHYHAWAYELADIAASDHPDATEAGELLRHYLGDWIARCSLDEPGARNLAWNAYAIATRISWWIRIYQRLGQARWQSWGGFEADFLHSLWHQVAYLHDHLEWDLLGNHVLRDAVGLAWAGRFFSEEPAQQWLARATAVARAQACEQVLADGGHFERSPLYHLHIMEDLRTLAVLVQDAAVQAELRTAWQRMAEYLAWMRHPDGRIPLFNDAALPTDGSETHALKSGEALGVAIDSRPRSGGKCFSDTGMAVWHGTPWSVFFDVGPVGPDYQPGHAHADTLAVECSYDGERLFVDAGTHSYDDNEVRRYDRSTAAHNTVCIDGQDSSEVWHIFRVGRRALSRDVRVELASDGLNVSASHTGYDHLPGQPRHTRKLKVRDGGELEIHDHVAGKGQHALAGGFLLAPRWHATPIDGGWLLGDGARQVRVTVLGPQGLHLSIERRPYHPQYGFELETSRLTWRVEAKLPIDVSIVVEGQT